MLCQFSTDSSDGTDGGGCNGAHSTCSTKGPWNSHSTGTVDSIHTDNSHSRIRNPDSHNNCIGRPDNQIQFLRLPFRLKPERQNAARERKPIRTPSMQLIVAFSL